MPNTLPFTLEHIGESVEYTYSRSIAAMEEGSTFTVEWHDDLQTGKWSSMGLVSEVISDNGLIQQVKATLPSGAADRRFVRLKVVVP